MSAPSPEAPRPLRFVWFVESVVADWDNPAATTTRAVVRSLVQAGHEVLVLEARGNAPTIGMLRARGSEALRAYARHWADVHYRTYDLPRRGGLEAQVWHGGMLGADAWIVPQGAPNADLAMDFINYATRPGPSADFSRLLPYGPVNPGAFDLLPAERRRVLPSAPENKTLQFVQNWNWWADNAEEAGDRFTAWVIAEDHDAGSPAPED